MVRSSRNGWVRGIRVRLRPPDRPLTDRQCPTTGPLEDVPRRPVGGRSAGTCIATAAMLRPDEARLDNNQAHPAQVSSRLTERLSPIKDCLLQARLTLVEGARSEARGLVPAQKG